MSFHSYPRYRSSGVDWIGDVPEHWHVKPLKYLVSINPEVLPENTDPGFELEYVDIGSVSLEGGIEGTEPFLFGAAPSRARRRVRDGDVIISTVRTYLKAIAAIHNPPDNLIASTGFAVLRPMQGFLSGFAEFALEASGFIDEVIARSTGVQYPSITSTELACIPLPTPPIEEQAAIAESLRQEIDRIQTLIREQITLVELLKEKRQAAISHAVTKGLDPHAPMRASAIEWLGEVPAHWTVARLGVLYSEVNESGNEDLPVLSVSIHTGVSDKELDDDELDRKVTRSEDRTKYKRVLPNDLTYNMMRAWQGGFGAVEVEGMVSPAYIVARPKLDLRSRFIECLLRTPCAVEEMRRNSYGVTDFRLRLYWDKFKDIKVAVPPVAEQDAVLEAVDRLCERTKALEDETCRAIDLLQERRSALISAAVTGKINVTALVAKPVLSTWSTGFARQVLAAETLSRCNGPRMGRIKLQKLIHLCEYHAQLDEVRGTYSRHAAGPFAPQVMEDVRDGLLQQRWFEEYKDQSRYAYRALENAGGHKQYLSHWERKQAKIDHVLNLLGGELTRRCEIVSTLYAAWNDLLIEGKNPSDAEIIHEASSAERWHESKEKIPVEKWPEALKWMRSNGLVPVGYGSHTMHQPDLFTRGVHEPAY